MNTRETIRDFIIDDLAAHTSITAIGDDEPLIESGIIDSLGILKLEVFLDETFGVTFSEGELVPQNLENLRVLCEFVEAKLKLSTQKGCAAQGGGEGGICATDAAMVNGRQGGK
jgi:acyl carrier protein